MALLGRKFVIYTVLVISILWSPSLVIADTTIDVNGNGTSSDNTVTVSQTTNTQVTSTNNAQVTNTVSSTSDTGGNSVDNSTGNNAAISTGNTTTNTSIANDLNTTAIHNDACCNNNVSINESGNGSGSVNNVTADNNTATQVTSINTAVIDNNITVNANTGNNSISNSTSNSDGSDTIRTGNIRVNGTIQNNNINNTLIKVPYGSVGNTTETISANGAFSTNVISLDNNQSVTVDNINVADVVNNGDIYANTGNNSIDNVTGANVGIVTGDIDINFAIANDINNDVVIISCGCPSTSPTPTPTSSPTPGGSSSEQGGGSGGGGGSSGIGGTSVETPATLSEAILPITGGVIPYMPILLAGFSILTMGYLLQYYGKKYAYQYELEQQAVSKQRKHYQKRH